MADSLLPGFDRIYDATYKKVSGYVIAKCSDITDTEDILQDIYSELFYTLKTKGCDYIREPEAFVMQIANTKLKRYYTQKSKRKMLTFLTKTDEEHGEYTEDVPENIDVEAMYINLATVREIWQVIRRKNEDIQKVFALHYYSGFTLKEIAEMLSLSESNVKHKLYRTLTELRTLYQK